MHQGTTGAFLSFYFCPSRQIERGRKEEMRVTQLMKSTSKKEIRGKSTRRRLKVLFFFFSLKTQLMLADSLYTQLRQSERGNDRNSLIRRRRRRCRRRIEEWRKEKEKKRRRNP
jgi:hypothetical protein